MGELGGKRIYREAGSLIALDDSDQENVSEGIKSFSRHLRWKNASLNTVCLAEDDSSSKFPKRSPSCSPSRK